MASISGLVKGAKDLKSSGFNWGGWASTLGQIGQQLGGADYQYQLGQKAAGQEWDRNLEMWNIQNAYNSPTAQMARLEQAGLNPNLAISGGTDSGNATTLPKYQQSAGSAGSVYPKIGALASTLSQFQDIQIKKEQKQQLNLKNRVSLASLWYDIERRKEESRKASAEKGSAWAKRRMDSIQEKIFRELYEKGSQITKYQSEANSAWLNMTMRNLEKNMYQKSGILFKDKPLWRMGSRYRGNPPNMFEPSGGWESWN